MRIDVLLKDLNRMREIYGDDMPVSLQQGLPNNVCPQDTTITPDFFVCEELEDGVNSRMGLKLRAFPY
ncbi:MAG: hypothetical protein WC479_04495 [Candidatus Izemoplasmatales bacterium]|jgi:hypothetical protein